MIIVDNSDWARNGDFFPTRWESQEEAANLVATAKCDGNPENCVGLMLMAGKQTEVLVTPMQESSRVSASFHGVKLHGKAQLSTALQIAQLALKHRQNKNQKQRIVVFVTSPIWEDEKTLVNLGKKLKRNGLFLDVINLETSDPEQNNKLQKLVESLENNENCHYLQVNPGYQMLSDVLLSSPILMGEAAGPGGNAGGAGDFGNVDPELEMAMRISLEEEKERERKRTEDEKKKTDNQDKIVEEKPAQPANPDKKEENIDDLDEEELLRRAQEMSLQDEKKKRKTKLTLLLKTLTSLPICSSLSV